MRPIKSNIIIKPEMYTTTESGLLIKSSQQERLTAIVVAVGQGTKKNPMTIQVGQRVVYHDNVGIEMEIKGEKHLLLRESHVIAVV